MMRLPCRYCANRGGAGEFYECLEQLMGRTKLAASTLDLDAAKPRLSAAPRKRKIKQW